MEIITSEAAYERIFDTPPPSSFRKEFSEFVQKTLRPEDYPGICVTRPPDQLNKVVMVDRFDLRGLNRAGPKIHCSMCNRKDQFLWGALYWFPQDGHIRLIGNCCAKTQDEENFLRANSMLTQDKLFKNACDYLENNLKHSPLLLRETSKLKPLCEKVMEDRNELKTIRGLLTELRKANKNDGNLKVEVPVVKSEIYKFLQSEGGTEKSDFRTETIHIIDGVEYVVSSFDPLRSCHRIISFFEGFVPPQAGCYDAMLLDIVDHQDQVISLADNYRQAVDKLRGLHQWLSKSVRFLSNDNLTGLKRFGTHKHTHFAFDLKFNDSAVRIESRDRQTVCVCKRGQAIAVPTLSLPDTV